MKYLDQTSLSHRTYLLIPILVLCGCMELDNAPTTEEQAKAGNSTRSVDDQSLESNPLKSVFDTQFTYLSLIWDFVKMEQPDLPVGYSYGEINSYLKRSLRPILSPQPDGTWKVKEIRETVLAKMLKNTTDMDTSPALPFLKDVPVGHATNHRKEATQEEYQHFVEDYIELHNDLTIKYGEALPIRRLKVEPYPTLSESPGQRILIYDSGEMNITSYLKHRDRLIGIYQQEKDGSLASYKQEFELDEMSFQKAQLFTKYSQSRILKGDKVLDLLEKQKESMLPRSLPRDFVQNLIVTNAKLFRGDGYQEGIPLWKLSSDSRNHIWAILEIITSLNPDAQIVLVFSSGEVNLKSELTFEGNSLTDHSNSTIDYKVGIKFGASLEQLVKRYGISFINHSMRSNSTDPSFGKIEIFKKNTKQTKLGLREFWMWRYVLERFPDLLIFQSLPNPFRKEEEIDGLINRDFRGYDDLTQLGMILVSNTNAPINGGLRGEVIHKVYNDWNLERLSLAETSNRGIFYTPLLLYKEVPGVQSIKLLFDLSMVENGSLFFNPFLSSNLDPLKSPAIIDDLRRSQCTSYATPVVLSYFNWLKRNNVISCRKQLHDLLNRANGYPILIDVQRWQHHLGTKNE